MFDLDRLCAAVAKHRQEAPAAIVDALIEEVNAFSGGHEPDDDQTLLVFGID
jgi:serine phosphatase RsbU (regulator of sigma subunit)